MLSVFTVSPITQLDQQAIKLGDHTQLELLPIDASAAGSGDIIEAQIPAQHYRELSFQEGDTLVLTPRIARVFVA